MPVAPSNIGSWRIWGALPIGLLLAGLAEAQPVDWIKPYLPSSPSARCCGNVVYDAATHSTVLFGGGINNFAFSDTWLFTRERGWSQLSPATSPPGLSGAGFAYDPISKTAVLFGGNPGNFVYSGETWTWDGTNWTQQFPSVSPPARAFNSNQMVYDAATGKVVLFGGYADGGRSLLGDTWVWNGTAKTWTELFPATSPSPRGTTLAYDSATKKVVVFGGDGGGSYLADTWTWDGMTWTQEFPASSPSARAAAGLAYDANIGKVVLFGGASTGGINDLSDTWSWSGTTWSQMQTSFTPYGRSGASMNYDPNFDGLVLFGGALANGSFGNSSWLLIAVR